MGKFDIVALLLILPVILLSLTVHEFAHGFAAYRMGDPTAKLAGRLTLNPLKHLDPIGTILIIFTRIGWAKPVPVNPVNFRNPARDLALVSFAGPTANLLLAVVCGLCFRLISPLAPANQLWASLVIQMLVLGVILNIVLAFFNLIPIPPLDGFAILAYLFPRVGHNMTYIRYGPYILMGLIALGFFLPIDPLGLYLAPFLWAGTFLLLGFPMGLHGG